MSNCLDHCLEICNLLKFSPRREASFSKLKSDITPHVPKLHSLCPTHWTVHAMSLENIHQNYPTFFSTWKEAEDIVEQCDVKARINGVAAKMKDLTLTSCFV